MAAPPMIFYTRKRKRSAAQIEPSSSSGKELTDKPGEEEKVMPATRCYVRRPKPSCRSVPGPVFIGATLLKPSPMEAPRRSARCLNRPHAPIYAEETEPKNTTGLRGRPKKKTDLDSVVEALLALNVATKTVKGDPKERKLIPISGTDFAAEDDAVGNGKSARQQVKETLRAFNTHYLQSVQEERKRADAVLQEIEANPGENKKRPSMRPDLKAIAKMRENKSLLYTKKMIGQIPGIDVGDKFYSRAEMFVLGMHNHPLKGIGYMAMEHRKRKGYENLTSPLATSIVLSGTYEDDLDMADEIIYTGEGGIDLKGNHRQISNQKMKGGNMALRNSKINGNPIRVIRGHKEKQSCASKVYTYDGLYKVVEYWKEKGAQGYDVFQYRLKRLEGQPSLTTSQVIFTRAHTLRRISELPGLVCDDISGGQENFPIPATNLVDNPPVPPPGFEYIKSLQISKGIEIPSDCDGCDCEGDCANNTNCSCAQLNGSNLPYVTCENVDRLVNSKAIVFECGSNCSCNQECVNRTSQQGLQYHLEVFKTVSKGWGVRTRDTILPGALIGEYVGVLRKTEDVEGSVHNKYIFDIDCLETMKGLDGREKRVGSDMHLLRSLDADNDSEEEVPAAQEYCIDGGSSGNFTRLINHSCNPNVFAQCVLTSHRDVKLAKVVFFAGDMILPLEELCYDYGYALNSVTTPAGDIIELPCYCGAANCRKRLY